MSLSLFKIFSAYCGYMNSIAQDVFKPVFWISGFISISKTSHGWQTTYLLRSFFLEALTDFRIFFEVWNTRTYLLCKKSKTWRFKFRLSIIMYLMSIQLLKWPIHDTLNLLRIRYVELLSITKKIKHSTVEKFLLSNLSRSHHSGFHHILLYKMWSEPEWWDCLKFDSKNFSTITVCRFLGEIYQTRLRRLKF